MKYEVGINTEDLSNLPFTLWEIVKPVIFSYLQNLLFEYLKNLIQGLLNSFSQICGLAPFGFGGMILGMVVMGRKKRNHSDSEAGCPVGTWFVIFGQLIGTVVMLLTASMLFKAGRELIWWNGVIKNAGLAVLGLTLLLLVWSAIRLVRWVNDLGLNRTIIIMLVILIPTIFLHGQRYRINQPILTRYFSSTGDLAFLVLDKAMDFWSECREFTHEFTVLLRE